MLGTEVSLWTDYVFLVIAIDRLMDAQTTTHGLKIRTMFSPSISCLHMETIATLSEKLCAPGNCGWA